MRRMDLSNIPLNGIGGSKTQNSPSGDANAASSIHEDRIIHNNRIKDGPEGDQDSLRQFYEDRIFNKRRCKISSPHKMPRQQRLWLT
jgi:hypothetical protein